MANDAEKLAAAKRMYDEFDRNYLMARELRRQVTSEFARCAARGGPGRLKSS
jgi:hypothetical protein